MKQTREIIVTRALELFNENGIEYVGLREIAKILDMRVSNITYYFATKDDLVEEMMIRLTTVNSNTLQKYDTHQLRHCLEMYREFFSNQYMYRCLFVSFVHIFTHHERLAQRYKQIEQNRRQRLANACRGMIANGELKEMDIAAITKLVAHLSLLARFWISESIVSYYDKSNEEIINHYLSLLCDVFEPIATAKGKRAITLFKDALSMNVIYE